MTGADPDPDRLHQTWLQLGQAARREALVRVTTLTGWRPGTGPGCRRGPDCGVCAAVDVHYLRTGGARAAAVLAADAAFAHVLAAGMPAADAADLVRRMAGRYRLPDALRRADTLARAGLPAATRTDRQAG